jgi:hypothetical protein
VVVVPTSADEQGVWTAEDHVEAEDVDIEVVNAVNVRGLEMHVADVNAGIDRARAALAWGHALSSGVSRGCLRAHIS